MSADPIEAIRQAGARLVADPDEAVRQVGEWLTDGGDAALLSWLGAEGRRGYSVRLQLSLARRDVLIVEAVELAFPGRPIAEQARLMSREMVSYESRSWPRDRLKGCNPYDPAGLKSRLFEIFRCRARAIGPGQIEHIVRSHQTERDRV
jgi:hypothetical protein